MTDRVVYSATILEHSSRPRNAGQLADADRTGEANNPLCGDRIRITLKLTDSRIDDVRFRAEACAICTAAASILTERIRGLEIGAAARIDDDQLIDSLETTLPTERRRCATLPLEALRAAVPAALSDLHSRDTETR